MQQQTIIEPFRIKSVEPLGVTTAEERMQKLESAGWNVFGLHADDVLIDLLTDSGTGAMSAAQWAALMIGDESYAGSRSFFRLEQTVRALTHCRHVIPTHQGRAAEHILFSLTAQRGRPGQRLVVPSNSFFDTTRANCEWAGIEALDLVPAEARDHGSRIAFKGDIDLAALECCLRERGDDVPFVLMTLTNNRIGGQPVSMANLRAVRALCDRYGKPLWLDAARFAENAWLVREREAGQGDRSPREIASEAFALCDGFVMSAKKDGLVHIGGLLACNDDAIAEQARTQLILTEGFPTYGGLAGRDLEALAVGLGEVLEPDYLRYRIASVRYLHDKLDRLGVPLVQPHGGHAVFVDAAALYPHLDPAALPGVALCNALYVEGGVRAVEIGTLMFGRAGTDGAADEVAGEELVRLALPRRTYTQSHVDYVAEVFAAVFARRGEATGFRIVEQRPVLRAFTARLAPLDERWRSLSQRSR
ncbi:MAG: tryptophanase [Deltaproteobacteria bacterium]|nr:tryptophanase [Deltaproteobacteria bacterium]